jgi:CysZ protein
MNEALARPPRPLPDSPLGALLRGVGYPLEALGFIGRHRLWGLCLAAIAVNVLVFGALVGVGLYLVVPWAEAWVASWAAEWARALLVVLVWLVLLVLAVGVASVILLLVGQAIASPFLDVLSERAEKIVTGREGPKLGLGTVARSIRVALGDLFWGLVYYVAVNVPLLLLGLIPVIGTVPAAVASFLFSAMLLAQEFVGLPLTRQHVGYRGRWSFVLAHRAAAIGFGAAAMLLLIVPGLNLVLLPIATVGGTLLYCDLSASASSSPSSTKPALEAAGSSRTLR